MFKLCIAMFIICLTISGILVSQFVFSHSDYTPDQLYQAVKEHDYSKGRDKAIENYIKKYLEEIDDFTADEYSTILKSKVEYYYNLGNYHTSLKTVEDMERYTMSYDDSVYKLEWYAKNYEAMGNHTLADEFAKEKDRFTNKGCGS